MTLPTDFYFPPPTRRAPENMVPNQNSVMDTANSTSESAKYLNSLTSSLNDMYSEIANGVNGEQLRSTLPAPNTWTPTLAGTAVAGSYTYFSRVGLAQRIGLMTDVFFDIRWTDPGGAAGNLYLILPYRVTLTDFMPFVGPIQSSTLAYGAGTVLTCNAIPNTYRLEIWTSGSGVVTANIDAAVATAGRIMGSIRYIGQQDGRQ